LGKSTKLKQKITFTENTWILSKLDIYSIVTIVHWG